MWTTNFMRHLNGGCNRVGGMNGEALQKKARLQAQGEAGTGW